MELGPSLFSLNLLHYLNLYCNSYECILARNILMKKTLLILSITLGLTQITQAQVVTTADCEMMSLAVASSDTGLVNLYHPGGYLTSPSSENVIEWKVTDSESNIIYQDTVIGDSHSLFYHSIALGDTMNVTALLTNQAAIHNGNTVACFIEDQLYWKETEILPASFIGNWDILNQNPGVDVSIKVGVKEYYLHESDSKIYDLLGRELTKVPSGTMYIKNRKVYIKQ